MGVGTGAEVGVAAPARLLDDEAFFAHFFGRLTRGGKGGGADAAPTPPPLPPVDEGGGWEDVDGDGPDARILEEVNLLFKHAMTADMLVPLCVLLPHLFWAPLYGTAFG